VPTPISRFYGDNVALSDQGTLGRTHYTFQGWDASADALKALYAPGGAYLIEGDATLYAVWQENAKYTVSYNANGGAAAPTDANTYYADDTVTVKANGSLTRNGYAFQGWSTSRNGASTYVAGDTFKITGNTTLYAVWQQNEVTPVTPPPTDGGTGTVDPATPQSDTPSTTPQTDTGAANAGESGEGAVSEGTNNTGAVSEAGSGAGATGTGANAGTGATETDVAGADTGASAGNGSPLALLSGNGERVSQEELREIARDAGIPLVGIGENGVPLIGVDGYVFWSLVDLALVLAGVLFAVWQILAYRRRREESEKLSAAAAEAEAIKPNNKQFKLMLVVTLANAVLFLLSQDFSATPLVMLDIWSIPISVLLIAECVLGRTASKQAKAAVAGKANTEVGKALDARNA
jgi:uncharacterized repeat protein (TIGR02543 family)